VGNDDDGGDNVAAAADDDENVCHSQTEPSIKGSPLWRK